jgi:hypothetical protein
MVVTVHPQTLIGTELLVGQIQEMVPMVLVLAVVLKVVAQMVVLVLLH